MQTLWEDLRFTARQLRRSPGFLATVVLTLTMAIAANVVVYGIANALLLHSLPLPDGQALVQVQSQGFEGVSVSYPNYRDLRDRSRSFTDMAVSKIERVALGRAGHADAAVAFAVSGNYFQTLGVKAQLGRMMQPNEDFAPSGAPVTVLSDLCWRRRFHGDPAVVGSVVSISKHPYTVVGVAPRGFFGTEHLLRAELWVPYHAAAMLDGFDGTESRGANNSWIIGRLQPGVTRAAADADLRRVSEQMAREFGATNRGLVFRTATPGLIGDSLGRPVRAFIAGVSVLALLVLLAACANLGVLFSARTADRARELGIRLAVGSSRTRILRQLVTESVAVSLLGGAVAAVLAAYLLQALSRFAPPSDIPIQVLVDADWTAYAVAGALSLLTGVFFGLLPARQIWRTDPNVTMRAAGSTTATDRSPLRSALLVTQIALCCLLVTSSFVALRGLQRTYGVPLGFEPRGVTLASMDLLTAGYDGKTWPQVQQRLLHAVEALPGVSDAAYVTNQPLSLNSNNNSVYSPGTAVFDAEHTAAVAKVFQVSPGYFRTARTPLLAGREFTASDTAETPSVAVVNQTFARRVFGTTDVIGKYYLHGSMGRKTEVVGLVPDGKYTSLSEDPAPAYFESILQSPDSSTVLLVRSNRDPAEMTRAVQAAIAGVDPGIPIFRVSSWPDALGLVQLPAQIATVALGVLGALAAMLAVTGIFGVASYTVARRLRELGIRVALGARAARVLRAALGRTAVLLGVGSLAGLLLGVAATRLLAGVVYHATASDPLVLLGVVLTMLLLGLASSALPARRALRVEPAELLREK